MRKLVLLMGLYFRDPEFIKSYKLIKNTRTFNKKDIEDFQNKKLIAIINHAYETVPYYRQLFDDNNINPNDIKTKEDLYRIPILTKKDIVENYDMLVSKKFNSYKVKEGNTGGSTGRPLRYITTSFDTSLSMMLLFNGFSYAGYKLGEKVVTLGGSSVVKNNQNIKSKIIDKIKNTILNFKTFSIYNTDSKTFNEIISYINKNDELYVRGYKSSIYLLCKYIEDNNIRITCNIKAVFTTSEKLLPEQRRLIESVLHTKVYDQYGLNDGGISAYQNESGEYLIDFERSIIEVIDNDGNSVTGKEGRIIGTALHNYVMPFIRYDSEDLGIVIKSDSDKDLLKEIIGKSNDIIAVGENMNITPILNSVIRKYPVNNYQIIRTKECLHVKVTNLNEIDRQSLEKKLISKIASIKIIVKVVQENDFIINKNGKHKFIIDDSQG